MGNIVSSIFGVRVGTMRRGYLKMMLSTVLYLLPKYRRHPVLHMDRIVDDDYRI